MELFATAAIILVSLALHEYAHAYMADHLGDPTPKLQGRLTINPLAHLDPLGTLFILMNIFGPMQFFIGWGKPVVFDPFNLQNPKQDIMKIAFAGPLMNIGIAIVAGILLRFIPFTTLTYLLTMTIVINIGLATFNLLPIFPLDGYKVVAGLLPQSYEALWEDLARYGNILLIISILPLVGGVSIASVFTRPIASFLIRLLIP